MEESISSSVSSALCSKDGSASSSSAYSEESSWTMYLEDFMASEERKAGGLSSISMSNMSSVVSDAASCIESKPSTSLLKVSKGRKELRLKKRKGKGLLDDDLLEDTASSVNSPKVSELSCMAKHPRKKDDYRDISRVEEVASSRNKSELRKEIVDGLNYHERTHDCVDMRRQGIQLFPLSMYHFAIWHLDTPLKEILASKQFKSMVSTMGMELNLPAMAWAKGNFGRDEHVDHKTFLKPWHHLNSLRAFPCVVGRRRGPTLWIHFLQELSSVMRLPVLSRATRVESLDLRKISSFFQEDDIVL